MSATLVLTIYVLVAAGKVATFDVPLQHPIEKCQGDHLFDAQPEIEAINAAFARLRFPVEVRLGCREGAL